VLILHPVGTARTGPPYRPAVAGGAWVRAEARAAR
jgi:hypothetical protein